MKIDLLVTGKTGERYLNDGIELYQGRLKSYCNFNWREIPSKKWSRSLTPDQIKKKEGELILKEISSKERVVLLDERGLSLTSVQFASFLQKESLLSSSKLLFVIGGAWGFHSSTYQRADRVLSLSPMTLSHQMVRLLFVEQLYRAFTIIKGEPYHHL